MSKTFIKVRYAETDKMGIVYHSNYYIYFEVAREDFIEETGLKYKELEDLGIMMPLVETWCKYYLGAKYGDKLSVETKIEELTPVKVKLSYTVRRDEDNKLIAKGTTLQTFVDSKSFRIINLKKKYPEVWEKFQKIL